MHKLVPRQVVKRLPVARGAAAGVVRNVVDLGCRRRSVGQGFRAEQVRAAVHARTLGVDRAPDVDRPVGRARMSVEHRAQPGKIVGERAQDAEPVLPIVDFEALERSQAVVRFDEGACFGPHGAAGGRHVAHTLAAREWGHSRASHAALQREQFHTAAAKEALARNLSAFRASSWTSLKLGI